VCALAITATPAFSAVINGGFEANSFENWLMMGTAAVVGTHSTTPGNVVPIEGSYQAHIRTNGIDASELATFLGVTESQIESANGGVDATNGSAIKTGVNAQAGDEITFYWRFLEEDYMPFDDFAFVSILTPGANGVTKFASLETVGPDEGSTLAPWTPFTYTFQHTGIHWFGFGIVNVEDTSLDSSLFIDAIEGDVESVLIEAMPEISAETPEPGSMMLLGAGMTVLTLIRRRMAN
jgi:hypothetical protein